MPSFLNRSKLPTSLPLTEVGPLEAFTGTSGSVWKIYGARLVSTEQVVSVFVFDKNSIKKTKQKLIILKNVQKHCDILLSLQKYNARVLHLLIPPKENRKYIAYATEPTVGSLANLLGDYPSDISPERAALFDKTTLCEVEVKYGISHLAESLSYLHLAEHMFHCDVSPRNVIVCAKGTWKLSGFHFCQSIEKPVTIHMDTSPTPITNNYLQPDINYAAPCIFLGQPTTHSDVYSLGMLVTAVHNDGTSLMESTGLVGLIDSHTAKMQRGYNSIKKRIPNELQEIVLKLVSFNSPSRPTAQQLIMLTYFQDPLLKSLHNINTLELMTPPEQEQFFATQLIGLAQQLPQKMLRSHILPILEEQIIKQNYSPGIIRSLVTVIERATSDVREYAPLLRRIIINSNILPPQSHSWLMTSFLSLLNRFDTENMNLFTLINIGLDTPSKIPLTCPILIQLALSKHRSEVITTYLSKLKRSLLLNYHQLIRNLGVVSDSYIMIAYRMMYNSSQFRASPTSYMVEAFVAVLNAYLSLIVIIGSETVTRELSSNVLDVLVMDTQLSKHVSDFFHTMLEQPKKHSFSHEIITNNVIPNIRRIVSDEPLETSQCLTLIQLLKRLEKFVEQETDSPATPTSPIPEVKVHHISVLVQPPAHTKKPSLKPPSFRNRNRLGLPLTLSCSNMGGSDSNLSRSNSTAARHRKLCEMDLSPTRVGGRSLGELMCEDDRRTWEILTSPTLLSPRVYQLKELSDRRLAHPRRSSLTVTSVTSRDSKF